MSNLSYTQTLAAFILQSVRSGENLTVVLSRCFSQYSDLSKQQKGALQDISFGCQRYLGTLLYCLRSLVAQPLAVAEVENLLLVAFYQLMYSKTASYAVVDGAVEAISDTAQGKFKGLVNGVLRNFLRQKDKILTQSQQDEVAKYNHPKWWIRYLKQHYPKYWHNILQADQRHPPLTLRINARKTNMTDYIVLLQQSDMNAKILSETALCLDVPVSVEKLPGFYEGLVSVQDFGAQKAAELLQPRDGERILDACAAPGGKTGHILELADCQLVALDIDPSRLKRVSDNLERLQLQATLRCADAAKPESWFDGQPFDAVLADVPCSASGIVRRHPDIKWLRQEGDAEKIAKQQECLLDQLWSTLKQSGRMLLATCSIFVEENSQQLEHFLSRHPEAFLLEQHIILPSERTDGFYYALIQKH